MSKASNYKLETMFINNDLWAVEYKHCPDLLDCCIEIKVSLPRPNPKWYQSQNLYEADTYYLYLDDKSSIEEKLQARAKDLIETYYNSKKREEAVNDFFNN